VDFEPDDLYSRTVCLPSGKYIVLSHIIFTPTGQTVTIPELLATQLVAELESCFKRRSMLFVPLNKPQYRDKIFAGEIPADGFIWDLEDSVPVHEKEDARRQISNLPAKPRGIEHIIRINTGEPDELEKDLAAITSFPFDTINLAKVESAAMIEEIKSHMGDEYGYLATVETLSGLKHLDEICSVLRAEKDALGFGIGDMTVQLGIERIPSHKSALIQQILGQFSVAGMLHGLDLLDAVSTRISDLDVFRQEALLAKNIFGFTGKKLVHPAQVAVANEVFLPTIESVEQDIATIKSFTGDRKSNARMVNGEYRGLPALNRAFKNLRSHARHGYLA